MLNSLGEYVSCDRGFEVRYLSDLCLGKSLERTIGKSYCRMDVGEEIDQAAMCEKKWVKKWNAILGFTFDTVKDVTGRYINAANVEGSRVYASMTFSNR